jgi:hypothetical protein
VAHLGPSGPLIPVWASGAVRAIRHLGSRGRGEFRRAAGREELSARIGHFLATNPGATVAIDSGIDEHHRYARFAFVARDGDRDGNVIVLGMDFVALDADGLVTRIVGFSGPMPAAT